MAKLKWVIEIHVDESWVADGFNLESKDEIIEMLQNRLPFAYSYEVGGKILKSPDPKKIRKLQGYKESE